MPISDVLGQAHLARPRLSTIVTGPGRGSSGRLVTASRERERTLLSHCFAKDSNAGSGGTTPVLAATLAVNMVVEGASVADTQLTVLTAREEGAHGV